MIRKFILESYWMGWNEEKEEKRKYNLNDIIAYLFHKDEFFSKAKEVNNFD